MYEKQKNLATKGPGVHRTNVPDALSWVQDVQKELQIVLLAVTRSQGLLSMLGIDFLWSSWSFSFWSFWKRKLLPKGNSMQSVQCCNGIDFNTGNHRECHMSGGGRGSISPSAHYNTDGFASDL
ncbi:hypothetical protein L5515_015707 [Caenorhabditis briggsae]|uniref:Uncharacterized protein n=1 Tax=Caenorhabditis briggsae TaxID=6238 RepID=A0AAE9ECF6_CAEBR|nr:hypothetical protein L5515_015707 [Caenorhabditis briggsae]